MKKRMYKKTGQTLVEAIVVVGVVLLLVTGLIAGTTSSLRNSQSVRSKSEATKYASAAIEQIRILRDASWNTFVTSYGGKTFCYGDDLHWNESSSCTPNIITSTTQLTRTVTFTLLPDNSTMHVQVTVYYPERASSGSASIDTYLTHWR